MDAVRALRVRTESPASEVQRLQGGRAASAHPGRMALWRALNPMLHVLPARGERFSRRRG